MTELSEQYMNELDALAQEIQESELHASFVEEEEEELYVMLQEAFEPRIAALYQQVAENDPLQLEVFEKVLLHEAFEGLFLPKVIGFSVLRGETNQQYKYNRPQVHFKEILLAICDSANFEFIRKRIGQSIQIGFALSSDIWITDLINHIPNKRIRYYLQTQKLEKYRELSERQKGYAIYSNQFRNENFLSAEFPTNFSELKTQFSELKRFLLYRVQKKYDNTSLLEPIKAFINHPDFQSTHELVEVLGIYANFFELDEADQQQLKTIFNDNRRSKSNFDDFYFDFLLEMHDRGIEITPENDRKVAAILDESYVDQLTEYYQLLEMIHNKGYINPEVMEAVKEFYNRHEGLSRINESIRNVIFNYLKRLISNLEPTDYHEFFEISKIYAMYMHVFSNQHFNQQLREICMAYLGKLFKKYTDKRGRDYQDIKKFVSSTFVELNFMREKEIVELFKTRRKKQPAES